MENQNRELNYEELLLFCDELQKEIDRLKADNDKWSSEWNKRVSHIGDLSKEINKLKAREEKLIEGLEDMNDTAPPMYEYNKVEMKIIFKIRALLKELKEENDNRRGE